MNTRRLDPFDKLLSLADDALRTTLSGKPAASRPNPANAVTDDNLTDDERRHSAGLMRVNHAGEIAAQALYQGQALTARLDETREEMERAAAEEMDHLAWCTERLEELGHEASRLTPLWYAGGFAIGALAGLIGDRWSLGFVAETERQVVEHLASHLDGLPDTDHKSRSIVTKMQEDEARHGESAAAAGGAVLPRPVRDVMRLTAKVMTKTAYRV